MGPSILDVDKFLRFLTLTPLRRPTSAVFYYYPWANLDNFWPPSPPKKYWLKWMVPIMFSDTYNQSSWRCQRVVRQSSGSHQAVIRQSLGSHQAVVRLLWNTPLYTYVIVIFSATYETERTSVYVVFFSILCKYVGYIPIHFQLIFISA